VLARDYVWPTIMRQACFVKTFTSWDRAAKEVHPAAWVRWQQGFPFAGAFPVFERNFWWHDKPMFMYCLSVCVDY